MSAEPIFDRQAGVACADKDPDTTKYPIVTCCECGQRDQAVYVPERIAYMVTRSLCFSCSHWTEHLEANRDKDKDRFVIVKGQHFLVCPDSTPEEFWPFRGHGGAAFTIKFFDGREVTSRNLWHQGIIPEHFRERMPDNAEFVTMPERTTRGYVDSGEPV